MIPRDLECLTALHFEDRDNHYVQNFKGLLIFKEGEIINLQGDLGVSGCRRGFYKIYYDIPINQLTLNNGKPDVLYKAYKCIKELESNF